MFVPIRLEQIESIIKYFLHTGRAWWLLKIIILWKPENFSINIEGYDLEKSFVFFYKKTVY